MKAEWKCCKNVGENGFVACGRPATKYYRHDDSVCTYCDEHDYQCGQPIECPEDEDANLSGHIHDRTFGRERRRP